MACFLLEDDSHFSYARPRGNVRGAERIAGRDRSKLGHTTVTPFGLDALIAYRAKVVLIIFDNDGDAYEAFAVHTTVVACYTGSDHEMLVRDTPWANKPERDDLLENVGRVRTQIGDDLANFAPATGSSVRKEACSGRPNDQYLHPQFNSVE